MKQYVMNYQRAISQQVTPCTYCIQLRDVVYNIEFIEGAGVGAPTPDGNTCEERLTDQL